MSDDQYFGTGGIAVIYEDAKPFVEAPRPTIGQTWTDPETGKEVMVVPVKATPKMLAEADRWTDLVDASVEVNSAESRMGEFQCAWSAMLASLRAKEGK